MEDIFVIGTGMTKFGKHLARSIKDLTAEAVGSALTDAGIDMARLNAAFFANSTQGHLEGQHMVRGQVALRSMGLTRVPVVNVENACASGSTALNLAVNFLKAGAGDIALAIGAEKMISTDKAKMFSSFDGAWDVAAHEQSLQRLVQLGEGLEIPPGTTSVQPYSLFMDVYAALAKAHMKRFGTTQRQIAAVAAKNHQHSVHNPRAQFQRPFSIEEVLRASPVVYPLTVPMCSPVSDGASAVIVATGSAISRYNLDRTRAVRVRASVIQTGSDRTEDQVELHCTTLAAKRAYEMAQIGPGDISLAEVHDATAVAEIIQIENLGFYDFGEGGAATERGETSLGGRIPVNPSGGLVSKGHPIGATGLAQIYELVTQLRGEAGPRQVEGARFGLAENGGGLYGIEEAVATVTILER